MTVRSYETDPVGRLQAPILCKLLQEVAVVHAAILGVAVETLLERGTAWVLSRFELTIDRWPGADDEIVIETWPEAMDRLFVERRFTVMAADETAIGSVSTLWCVLDLERRRPLRLPTDIGDRMGDHDIGSEPMRPEPLPAPGAFDRELAFTVRRSDLDLSDHVNNTSYVEWAIEAVPDEVWSGRDLARLEIQFLSECHHGHTVLSRSRTLGGEVQHQLVREEDGVEVARARTVWRERGT
jgi:acyl-ACP thioesterase